MTLRRLASLTAGFGMLAMALSLSYALVVLLGIGPAADTLAGAGIVVLFGNLVLAWAVAGLCLLDAPTDGKTWGIRNLTPAGWGLVAVTANVMGGVVIGITHFPEIMPLLFLGRLAYFLVALVGLAVFVLGSFVLSRFGWCVWRKSARPD